ncbi:peptide-methionine (R)-S-oxide reductase [Aeromicrobium panaciterrae]|uniref:peptide-methionine (R)-S-oxide reductase n=1 Tax=Aeromicrobium panaciterrae TaxID=363861 RepID=A0ABU1UND5_9ACTN|nr:peptide-methionine (R)-S-oxide reductase MsrB [Aeromicrobium panaciterrae]MDR7086677.1 peptide-methionine (R)-S-oxide reductase [Aeromicrobium panaciterrae]
MAYDVEKTEEEWKAELSPAEYDVLRKAGTERPFSSSYETDPTVGVYKCRACNAELFRSNTKFDAHCGWPAFYEPLAEDRVEYIEDRSMFGGVRTEVRCATCGSHLGHVFKGEGFGTPTDERFCINGIALSLEPKND